MNLETKISGPLPQIKLNYSGADALKSNKTLNQPSSFVKTPKTDLESKSQLSIYKGSTPPPVPTFGNGSSGIELGKKFFPNV